MTGGKNRGVSLGENEGKEKGNEDREVEKGNEGEKGNEEKDIGKGKEGTGRKEYVGTGKGKTVGVGRENLCFFPVKNGIFLFKSHFD